MSMLPEELDIDVNRRTFIKASFVLAGAFVLGKIFGLLSLPSKIAPTTSRTTEYRDARYGFSVLYPSDLKVSTFDEGGDAATITFQNVGKVLGFQIYVVPYSEAQVSEQRFKQDEPSGVRESLTNIVVDGATAAAFYSVNAALGATREVWFVHGGFLYEVTTLKPLDAWFDEIMQTWKFV